MTITRRTLLSLLPGALLLPGEVLAAPTFMHTLWIGTGTDHPGSKGIYAAQWDEATGHIGTPVLAAEVVSPTFLARNPKGTALYALSEMDPGKVTAYRTQTPASLTKLNEQPSLGAGPAHVSVHPSGRSVFVANYGGGSITSYAVEHDGSLSAPVSHFVYSEPGKQSHAHCVTPSPDDKWLVANDLGLNRLLVYRVNGATGELVPNQQPSLQMHAGAGPRHFVFHPNGRWAYSVNESDSTADSFAWNSTHGTLQQTGTVSTLPPDWPKNTAFPSEILVSPDGRFVYVGNRRNETIAMLTVNPANGTLSLQQLQPHGGISARHVTLSPTSRWLLVANQDSGNIVVMARDPQTGKLSSPSQTLALASPQCLVFSA